MVGQVFGLEISFWCEGRIMALGWTEGKGAETDGEGVVWPGGYTW